LKSTTRADLILDFKKWFVGGGGALIHPRFDLIESEGAILGFSLSDDVVNVISRMRWEYFLFLN